MSLLTFKDCRLGIASLVFVRAVPVHASRPPVCPLFPVLICSAERHSLGFLRSLFPSAPIPSSRHFCLFPAADGAPLGQQNPNSSTDLFVCCAVLVPNSLLINRLISVAFRRICCPDLGGNQRLCYSSPHQFGGLLWFPLFRMA